METMPKGSVPVRRLLAGMALAVVVAATLIPFPAAARVRGFVGFGFNLGVPVFPPPPPVVYAPPPVYYVPPPPLVYSPPPVYAPAAATAPSSSNGQYCREYQSSTVIDGKPQALYGTACLQPDGTWRIIN
jgi:hypothetical protein